MRSGRVIAPASFGGESWRAMVALRHAVLRAPLGLAYDDAQLEAERAQIHLAAWQDGTLAGTLLLVPPEPGSGAPDRAGLARLRQMAVAERFAGAGLGRALVTRGEAMLVSLGASRVMLSARASAIGFYQRLGYVAEGPSHVEVTLPHRTMRKQLRMQG